MSTALRTTNGVSAQTGFDKISVREGFDTSDEYLMLNGVSSRGHAYDDANSISGFSAHGRRRLCEVDTFNGPTMSFHNALTVARDGLGNPDVPQAAEPVSQAAGTGYAYIATRLPDYNGVDWTRHILWQPDLFTFVLDEVATREEADISHHLRRRLQGWAGVLPGRGRAAPGHRGVWGPTAGARYVRH